MIACVYGTGSAAFVEPTVRSMATAAAARGTKVVGVNLEKLLASPSAVMSDVLWLYILPVDLPASAGDELLAVLKSAFPKAQIVNALPAHTLCCNRVLLSERLLDRGVPVPETLLTDSPDEARKFVKQHGHAMLREIQAKGSGSGLLLFCDRDGTVAGEARGRRYVVELDDAGGAGGRELSHGVLTVPPPFFVQRMITRVRRHGVLAPAPVLRAFVIDDHIPFWIESYREKVERPSDFILTADSGALRRFVQVVSDEADKLARRVAEVMGFRIGAVDLIRSDSGFVVLDVITDGPARMIDRSFKDLPEFRAAFDLDRYTIESLMEDLAV